MDRKTRCMLAAATLSLGLAAQSVAVPAVPAPRAYGLGYPFTLQDLPFGDFRARLESLPAPAQQRAMAWLHRFEFTEQDLAFLQVDASGAVFYSDTFTPDAVDSHEAGGTEPGTAAAGLTAAEVFSLQSRPGSGNTLYLDFDGHLLSGTAWSSTDLLAVPYDTDGDPAGFSEAELANIAEIWRRIAEDFAPFDVNITTLEPATFGPTTGRILITADTDTWGNAMPSQGAGGVAYVNVWGRSDYSSRYSPALVYFNNLGGGRADFVSEAASHEAGHNLSLSHDATAGSSYYGGHGSGNISWGPIMGTGYYRNVSQWSNGDYSGASNLQDDIAILDGKLAYRTDDHADGLAGATRIVADTAGNIAATTPADDPDNLTPDNKGIIGMAIDQDMFYFDTGGGAIDLQITPAWQSRYTRGANLDIRASLYDANATLLQSSDPLDDTDARLVTSLPAGRYYLAVEGIGNADSPYSDYGSLGQYFITGTLPAVNDGSAPAPDPMSWTLAPQANGRNSIAMTATTANDASGVVEYRFECISGPAGCTAGAWQSGASYTAGGLLPGSTYEFQVRARDAFLNTTAPSATAAATTTANLAPSAVDDSASTDMDQPLTLDVLGNDSDPEGDALSIIGVMQGFNGSVSHTAGSLSYTPDPGFVGSDSFTYTIDDGFSGSASGNVSITVTAANSAPVANADSVSINAGDSITISVLANDSDPDGDA
ncbi:MAG TPA: Ig-like domain-containing protein, partial [Gammaproteobacteria bacterium]|nr:Ig-like domain-containing protein [Gammaproteobacteria bacterium]